MNENVWVARCCIGLGHDSIYCTFIYFFAILLTCTFIYLAFSRILPICHWKGQRTLPNLHLSFVSRACHCCSNQKPNFDIRYFLLEAWDYQFSWSTQVDVALGGTKVACILHHTTNCLHGIVTRTNILINSVFLQLTSLSKFPWTIPPLPPTCSRGRRDCNPRPWAQSPKSWPSGILDIFLIRFVMGFVAQDSYIVTYTMYHLFLINLWFSLGKTAMLSFLILDMVGHFANVVGQWTKNTQSSFGYCALEHFLLGARLIGIIMDFPENGIKE